MQNEDKKDLEVRAKQVLDRDSGEPTHQGVYYSPAVDIHDSGSAIVLVADLPGVGKDDLEVGIKDGVLSITGRVQEPNPRFQIAYREYGIGGFTRRFTLGSGIDQTKIGAELKDGVLSLTLPKADNTRPRKIEITTV